APVETNTLYSQDNKILKKKNTKLGFRLSLGFMPLITLSQFVSWIYNFILMRKAGVHWGNMEDIGEKWEGANISRAKSRENLGASLSDKPLAGGSF
ncbi:7215_t:CDS:1, partial [Funneliformis geosporum]